ncbi:MAG: hypothetical protein JWP57_4594 [Spirosoma sp.]|nr:hypothetical protein [Spirosoma sp.]
MRDAVRNTMADTIEEVWPDVNFNEAQRMAADLAPTVRKLIADEIRMQAHLLTELVTSVQQSYAERAVLNFADHMREKADTLERGAPS